MFPAISSRSDRGLIPAWGSRALNCLPLLVAALAAEAGFSAELWVDRNSIGGSCGDNRSRAEVTSSTPWCTLGTAANQVRPGDVVHVRGGEYTEIQTGHPHSWNSAVLQAVVTGTAEAPIKFVAEPGEGVSLSSAGGAIYGILITQQSGMVPRFIEIEGFQVRGFPDVPVVVRDTDDIVLRNLEVTGNTWAGISTNRSSRVVIEGCQVHHNALAGWTSAISLHDCGQGNVIRGNYVWANTDEDPRESEGHGIILDYCEAGAAALIENNVIWDNEGWCISIFNTDGAVIRNNTCYLNSLGRFDGTGELSVRGIETRIHNNILVSRDGVPPLKIQDTGRDLSTTFSDFNIFWSPLFASVSGPEGESKGKADFSPRISENSFGWDVNSLTQDPLLVDPAAANFLPTLNSPAVDSGTAENAAEFDVEEIRRPIDGNRDGSSIVDRGAYERRTYIRSTGQKPIRRVTPVGIGPPHSR